MLLNIDTFSIQGRYCLHILCSSNFFALNLALYVMHLGLWTIVMSFQNASNAPGSHWNQP